MGNRRGITSRLEAFYFRHPKLVNRLGAAFFWTLAILLAVLH